MYDNIVFTVPLDDKEIVPVLGKLLDKYGFFHVSFQQYLKRCSNFNLNKYYLAISLNNAFYPSPRIQIVNRKNYFYRFKDTKFLRTESIKSVKKNLEKHYKYGLSNE